MPRDAITRESQTILDDFGKFFAEFPDVERIDHSNFMLWFKAFAHPTLRDAQHEFWAELLLNVFEQDCDPALESGLLERLLQAETANRLASALVAFENGDEIDLYQELQAETQRYEKHTSKKIVVPWVDDDISVILEDDKDDRGLHFRLDCLNDVMRPLRGGDFIIMAGRPDKGKTTLIASEVTHMAAQFDALYGTGHGRYVLWFNNEGPGKRIVSRLYQAALGITLSEMIALSDAGVLREHYARIVGAIGRIRVLDVHDFTSHQIEDILRRFPPGLIVFDMIDNIRFGGRTLHGGERTDQVLETMYQWGRMSAVKFDTPVIASSQLPGSAEGVQFPTLAQLKDSTTGKQGAAEAIVTMGASNEDGYENSRFIGLTKNKLRRQGRPMSPKAEVVFDGERARLYMPGC